MRRSEKEIIDPVLVRNFLEGEMILRLGLIDQDSAYIVPVNYGLDPESSEIIFYFHSAKAGRKYRLCSQEPKASFEIDHIYRLVEAKSPCAYSVSFESIIGEGVIHEVTNLEEKKKALSQIFFQAAQQQPSDFSDSMLKATAVFSLKATSISFKKSN